MEWNPEEYLKKKHTKVLMDLKRSLYKTNGEYDIADHSGHVITIEQVKKELATREHVPNKIEAKIIRQNKAKFK